VYGDKRDRYGEGWLMSAGLACWFRKNSKDLRLGELERQARMAKRGLWADAQPVPPWEWRSRATVY